MRFDDNDVKRKKKNKFHSNFVVFYAGREKPSVEYKYIIFIAHVVTLLKCRQLNLALLFFSILKYFVFSVIKKKHTHKIRLN